MYLSGAQDAGWLAGFFLELCVCALATLRGLFRRLPFFFGYLVLVVSTEAAIWLTYYFAGMQSLGAFWIYWTTQAVLLVARAAVIAEICRKILRPYPGIWKLCRGVLIAIGAILVTGAAVAARHSGAYIHSIILTADRGLELAIVGILLFAVAFSRYYRVRIEPFIALLALGLGSYSAVQIANNTILNEWLGSYFRWWNQVHALSFNIATLIWLAALWKPLPEPQKAPVLLDQESYDNLQPQVNFRLRQLNARLTEMLR